MASSTSPPRDVLQIMDTRPPCFTEDTMTARFRNSLPLLLLLACVQPEAFAQSTKNAPPPDPTADPLLRAAGFLESHPDLRYRLIGLEKYDKKEHDDALRFFRRAAYYGDKPSQGMVAEMYWTGNGVPQDRPLAYAWMDLAAERGYAGFSGLRERYWSQMDETERARALEIGRAVYADYGDAAAQPRLANVLRRARRQMTGSRTGFTGNLQIYIPGPSGDIQIDGSRFYDERYWDPKQYQAWHDDVWMKPRIGKVSVGEVQQMPDSFEGGSRVPSVEPATNVREPETPPVDESSIGNRKDG